MKPCLVRCLAATVVLVSVIGAGAQSVTVGTADPGSGNEFPFGDGIGTDYEQVYNSTDFSGTLLINQISFFNTQYGAGTSSWSPGTYAFYLSTTAAAVNNLVGSDEGANNQLFGTYNLSGAVPSPQIVFNGTGFNYDPNQGNLLLDIQITGRNGASSTVFMDAMNGDAGTLMSRWYNYGSGAESFGLVTEFADAGNIVPDGGSTLMLLSGGSLCLLGLRRKFLS